MFSPFDPAADDARSTGFRAALKRSADRALALVTLEGYDCDDVRERFAPGSAAAAMPELMDVLRVPGREPDAAFDGTTGQPSRLRPTDPHRRRSAVTATARAGRPTVGASRRPTAAAAPAACTTPVAPAGHRLPRA